ncbi:DUF4974 domain-containing protein [Prolixibacteraceae bacterium JC049]|nr:DUF4974 domain-containing protein [Prolixibacteraceae bacterium JC049]
MKIEQKILDQIISGEANEKEINQFESWLDADASHQIEFAIYKQQWLSNNSGRKYNLEEARKRIDQKIDAHQQPKSSRFWTLRRIAAILVVPILAASLWITYQLNRELESTAPQLTTVECPLGAQKSLILPDGTQVKLNAGSKIEFPVSFKQLSTRDVTVTGEAFFDVTKNKQQPFIVHLGKIAVKVVGTSFNINNYQDKDQVEVYLNTGIIDLIKTSVNQPTEIISRIQPKHLATFNKADQHVEVNHLPSERYLSWTKGYLIFEDDPIKEVVKRLAKWYKVDISITDQSIENNPFTANLKGKSIYEVLEILELTSNIRYTVKTIPETDSQEQRIEIKLTK